MQPIADRSALVAADRSRIAQIGLEALVSLAGGALAQVARAMLGGTAGRRITVVVGPGLNGADGKAAARVLARRGAVVTVVELGTTTELAPTELVIDAAVGTGISRAVRLPRLNGAPLVLAADLPSGVDPATGATLGDPYRCEATVTFGAHKLGLLQGEGKALAGEVVLAGLGLEVAASVAQLLEVADLDALDVEADPGRHKWTHAIAVVAGSDPMAGSAALVAAGALRAGAGMVQVLGPSTIELAPEAVCQPRAVFGWTGQLAGVLDRCGALVVGPGLGRTPEVTTEVAQLLGATSQPLVLDADGLTGLGAAEGLARLLERRGDPSQVVLTPHDGEYRQLMGHAPGPDRLAAARALHEATGATVLLKGPTTVVVGAGEAYVVEGPASLATAGTGDVLAGVLGATLARRGRRSVPRAVGLGALLHAEAARAGLRCGLVASDLPLLIAHLRSARMDHGR